MIGRKRLRHNDTRAATPYRMEDDCSDNNHVQHRGSGGGRPREEMVVLRNSFRAGRHVVSKFKGSKMAERE